MALDRWSWDDEAQVVSRVRRVEPAELLLRHPAEPGVRTQWLGATLKLADTLFEMPDFLGVVEAAGRDEHTRSTNDLN